MKRTKFMPNEIVIKDCYAEIILYDKSNTEKARAIIDIDSIDIIKNMKWYLKDNGYVYTNKTSSHQGYYLHRLITNADDEYEIDHFDGNKLNNRNENLRVVNHSQNEQNKQETKHNTSGCRGVRFAKEKNCWHVGICVDGKRIHLGYIDSYETAVKIRKDAETKYQTIKKYNKDEVIERAKLG